MDVTNVFGTDVILFEYENILNITKQIFLGDYANIYFMKSRELYNVFANLM